MLGRAYVFTAAALVSLLLASPAAAAPFSVTRNDDPPPDACAPGDCSLREAVRAANAAPGADSITLPVGTYQLSQVGSEDAALTGDLDVTDDLTLSGAGLAQTTIDGGGSATADRVIEVDPQAGGAGPALTLADLTLTNGAGSLGAGLYGQNEARSTLERVSISGNDGSGFGGGVFNENSAVMTIRDSEFRDNSITGSFGSAIGNQNEATMTIERTVITGNSAPNGGFGGAVFNQNEASLTVSDSTIAGNSAAGRGGGFFIQNDSETVLERSTVSGNVAGGGAQFDEPGGGLYIQNDAVVTLRNVTVSGNRTDDAGGGIYLQNRPTVRLESTTVTANAADVDADADGSSSGGGVYAEFLPGGSVTLTSTIVAANTAGSSPDCGGTGPVSSAGFNLIGDSSACAFTPASGDRVGTAAAPLDARLGPLGANGGATLTHVPAGNSPAVDGGISSGLGTDQRGVARPQDASALPNAADGSDIGAVELPVAACGPVSGLRIDGGPQADVLVGSEGVDPIFAGAGDDQADGLGEADCLFGEAGADGLVGGPGDDRLDGGEQRDLLNGGPGKDRLIGDADKDRLKGAAGKDRLKGGDAKDRLNGGPGKDRLKGGPGKDRLKAVDGKRDRVNCGPGKRDRAVVDAKDKVSRSCEKVKLKSKRKRR